jgi:hypothetical protein
MEDKRLAAMGPNPSGLCMCGCGRKTKIVTKSDRRHGHVRGQPFRFIHGHSRPAKKSPNRYKLRCRTAVIFLERRDGTVLECLVSQKDFHRVRRHHWYVNRNEKGTFYAAAWIDSAQVQMHKHLCPHWAQVNHQNGNGLDRERSACSPLSCSSSCNPGTRPGPSCRGSELRRAVRGRRAYDSSISKSQQRLPTL